MWIELAAILLVRLVAEGPPTAPCLLDSMDRPVNCPAVAPPASRRSGGQATTRPILRGRCVNPVTHRPMKCLPEMLAPGRLEKAR